MTPASRFKRLIAYFIDSLILTIPTFLVAFLVAFVYALTVGTEDSNYIAFFTAKYSGLINFFVLIFYFSFFESSKYQATPGKKLFNLYVSDLDNQRISFRKAVSRYALWILPGIPAWFLPFFANNLEQYNNLTVNYWWVYVLSFVWLTIWIAPVFGHERTTLYDRLSGTRVNSKVLRENS